MLDTSFLPHLAYSVPPAGAAPAAGGRSVAAIGRAAREFEAVFLAEMLRPMFEGIASEPPFGGGLGEDIWRSLQISEFGKVLAARGGIGLADAVAREMLRLQEQASGERR